MARSNKETQRPQSAGLVGAIAAREKEKQDIRSGARGALVQQAIQASMQQKQQAQIQTQMQAQVQMQRQQQQQLQMQQMQAAYAYPGPAMGMPLNFAGGSPGLMPGGFPQPSPYGFTPQQQQPGFPQYQQQQGFPQSQQVFSQQGGVWQGQSQQQQQQQQMQMQMQPQPYGASWDRAHPQGQGGQRR